MTDGFSKEFERLGQIAKLWILGATAIVVFLLTIIGAQRIILALLSQAYLLVFILLGVLVIPILIALFILPHFGIKVENDGGKV